MSTIVSMYITLIPTILAGIINMVWCKINILNKLKYPLDFNKKFIDSKRIFGDNKTWKGLIGYILFNVLLSLLWGFFCNLLKINHLNYFYINHDNTILYNLLIGFLLGLAYSIFELPNSFIKRRLDIVPGKSLNGLKKIFFIFFDQADSVFGCCLVVWMFYDLTVYMYIFYVLLGAFTHIILNIILYIMKLRKNMF